LISFEKTMVYNEVVVLKSRWEQSLPHSVDAVMCTMASDCSAARGVHARFLRTYSLSEADVPLLRYSTLIGFTVP
jgi:hypothetical protein